MIAALLIWLALMVTNAEIGEAFADAPAAVEVRP